MFTDDSGVAWYAIRTRSRHEKLVDHQLAARGIESFLPLVTRRRRWADRWKSVSFPLFPGYCFARFPYDQHDRRLSVLTCIGAVQLVGIGDDVTPIPDDEIDAVRRLVASRLPLDPHPSLRAGMDVEVVRGPLEGMRGILIRKGRHARLVVAIRLIRQAASVELDAEDVQPVRTGMATASRHLVAAQAPSS